MIRSERPIDSHSPSNGSPVLMELYQTEWCPASRRVRQRLTELDLAYVIRQVPVERTDRTALLAATGFTSIPVLLTEDRAGLCGEDDICRYLEDRFEQPAGAEAHRTKAAKARRRELESAAQELAGQTSGGAL